MKIGDVVRVKSSGARVRVVGMRPPNAIAVSYGDGLFNSVFDLGELVEEQMRKVSVDIGPKPLRSARADLDAFRECWDGLD